MNSIILFQPPKTLTTLVCSLVFSMFGSAFAQDPELFAEIQPLAPLDSLATMVVQDGYQMELAAHEPMIEEAVLFTFDGDGRLYLAEMLTYMQDADGSGKFEKTSRIKRLVDSNNDGVFDDYTIFADGLLLPRMIQTLDEGRILVRETNTLDLLLLTDNNGDGVADTRETVYVGGDRGGNLEHQPNGLLWGIDNWMYVTYTDRRYRWVNGRVVAEPMAYGGGQWGLTQDHVGRLYYSTAGGQNPAFTFQFPSVYSRISVEGEQAEGFREVFPLDKTPDVQGGLPLLRDDNTLNHFTGGGGQSIYVGDKFDDMLGDYIITEPVGNLIRRAKVVREDGYTTLVHPYQEQRKEFIATEDANFRPVWTGTAPDGTLLILDMYRGIIQEGNWTQPGSYLREVIDKYGFDKIIGRGRLYRVTKAGVDRGEQPRLLSKSALELVEYLAHPNQWWRLEAQKLIVISQDRSVIPQLTAVARNHDSPLAQIHALWTLEGLGEVDRGLLVELMQSVHSDVRITAIRLSEQLVALGDRQVENLWRSMASDPDIEVAQQSVLSAYYTLSEFRGEIMAAAKAVHDGKKGLAAIEQAMSNLTAISERRRQLEEGDAALAEAAIAGEATYRSMCYTCHGEDGRGTVAGDGLLAPSLHNNERVNGNVAQLVSVALHGMTGPIDGVSYAGGQMLSIESNGDAWVANVLTYIRNAFGNEASLITPEQVAEVKSLFSSRDVMWTQEELRTRMSTPLADKALWTVSSNVDSRPNQPLTNLLDGNGDEPSVWRAATARADGQAITLELPASASITEVVIDSRELNNFYSRSYRIEFSEDGEQWRQVIYNPVGTQYDRNQTLGHRGKYIRITNQAGGTTREWRIREIDLVGSY